VLERAEKLNVPSKTFTKAQFTEGEVQKWLEEAEINVSSACRFYLEDSI